SSPIPVPKRKSVHPPPCSPIRDQDSPELVFNFEFSVSPDAPSMTSPVFLQKQGTTARLFPLQQQKAAAYLPLSALGPGVTGSAHPYSQEPFLYTVPRIPLQDAQNTCQDFCASPISGASAEALVFSDTVPCSTDKSTSKPSVSYEIPAPSCLPMADVSMHIGADENHPLTKAFRSPLLSASVNSSSASWSDDGSLCHSSFCRSPAPSPPRAPTPPRRLSQIVRQQRLLPARPKALQRPSAAAPVVSLDLAQAERPYFSSRESSPHHGAGRTRARRSSSVGTGQSVEKIRDSNRRMSTVIGRGAGRVVSLAEYRNGSRMSLVSDEDIERSLEKDKAEAEVVACSRGRSRSVSHRRRESLREEMAEKGGAREHEPERGRARARVPLRGVVAPAHTGHGRVLSGWR
ncbi:hypothetical protein BD413DRAFT_435383, partial [Trametes elegans]